MFGPTIQGEGPMAGRRAAFLRTWGCNLDCVWCDTPYTWDVFGRNGRAYDRDTESEEHSTPELVDRLGRRGLSDEGTILVLTGGEPLIQARACAEVGQACVDRYGTQVWVETNGTRPPLVIGADPARHVVSPKLANSRIPVAKRLRFGTLAQHADIGSAFKFVVCSAFDLDEVDALVCELGICAADIWIMPEGITAEVVLDRGREIADEVIERGWNLTLRTHTLLWGAERCR